MIVADANVIAYYMLPAADPAHAANARRIFASKPPLALPTLWRHEYLNTLVFHLRGGHLSLDAAEILWWSALDLFESSERPLRQVRVLELGKEMRLAGYDAQYLALAEDFGATVITEDKKLKKAAPGRCMSMAEWLKKN